MAQYLGLWLLNTRARAQFIIIAPKTHKDKRYHNKETKPKQTSSHTCSSFFQQPWSNINFRNIHITYMNIIHSLFNIWMELKAWTRIKTNHHTIQHQICNHVKIWREKNSTCWPTVWYMESPKIFEAKVQELGSLSFSTLWKFFKSNCKRVKEAYIGS